MAVTANYAYRWHHGDGLALGTKRLLAVQIAVGLLLLIVVWSVVARFVIDMPNLAAGTLPEDEFDHRYVEQPWLAYLHIVPGAVYLLLAPLQLAYRIRSRHYTFHRRLGRVLATAGMISGVFALIFGGLFSFGGLPEASAAVVFGLWFLTCLVLAVRAIRRDDIVHHRRWMIRAFAIGIGIGTTRIWLLILGASRARLRLELRSGILDLVHPACADCRAMATGLSESSRARPGVAGFQLESTRRGYSQLTLMSQDGGRPALRLVSA